MYKSVILPLAKQDILDAARWYNKQSPGLGRRFTHEVRDIVQYIRQNPAAFGIRYDQIRTAVLKVFPFMIHIPFCSNFSMTGNLLSFKELTSKIVIFF